MTVSGLLWSLPGVHIQMIRRSITRDDKERQENVRWHQMDRPNEWFHVGSVLTLIQFLCNFKNVIARPMHHMINLALLHKVEIALRTQPNHRKES
eukprot:scaffold2281_cov43-Cyclotella_meneghiniana.AAC.3